MAAKKRQTKKRKTTKDIIDELTKLREEVQRRVELSKAMTPPTAALPRSLRRELLRVFGYTSWQELRAQLEEPADPFPFTISWRCIAIGRQRDGRRCIYNEAILENPLIDKSYVAEDFTYLRLKENDTIYRYQNPPDMIKELKIFDASGLTDLEEGIEFILQPVDRARSLLYSINRRAAIKNGTHTVKPRGPNSTPRRQPAIHYRPYAI